MRILCVIGLILATCCVIECRRHHHDKMSLKLEKIPAYRTDDKPLSNTFHTGSKHHIQYRGKHLHFKEGGSRDSWMSPPKDLGCKEPNKCSHKQYCVADPESGAEKCISKRKFQEGRRLFKDFHKQTEFLKKDLRTYGDYKSKDHKGHHHKGHEHKGHKMDYGLKNAEHMKDVYDLLGDYKKHGHKDIDIKSMMKGGLKAGGMLHVEEADPEQGCRPQELYELKKRMVGWFVLLHTESRGRRHRLNRRKHHKKGGDKKPRMPKHIIEKYSLHGDVMNTKKEFMSLDAHKRSRRSMHDAPQIETQNHHGCKCSRSVMWDFHKNDANKNRLLEHEEIASLEHLKREPCMKLLFDSCDTDKDGSLTHGEWCCCMADTIPPCAEKKRLTDPKSWVPRCDKEGYYQREQCHDQSGYCWCVDINGNEIHSTKTLGNAHCGKYDPNGQLIKE